MEFIKQYSGLIALVIFLIVGVLLLIFVPEENEEQEEVKENKTKDVITPLNLDDQDATVACLVAAIECRNEYHKNVQIISVREVK